MTGRRRTLFPRDGSDHLFRRQEFACRLHLVDQLHDHGVGGSGDANLLPKRYDLPVQIVDLGSLPPPDASQRRAQSRGLSQCPREQTRENSANMGRQFPRLRHLWADQGCIGPILDWIATELGWSVAIVERSPRRGFRVTPGGQFERVMLPATFEPLPRRWVVERSLAWIGRHRRMSKDYEQLPSTSEALVYLTSIRLLLERLTRAQM